jgi:hypothetical protein
VKRLKPTLPFMSTAPHFLKAFSRSCSVTLGAKLLTCTRSKLDRIFKQTPIKHQTPCKYDKSIKLVGLRALTVSDTPVEMNMGLGAEKALETPP